MSPRRGPLRRVLAEPGTPYARLALAGLLGLASAREQKAQEQVARATRAMPTPKIKDVSVIECQPEGVRLTVVKITTDQDGLYGYGCATFTQRADLVKPAVERYLKPLLMNHPVDKIEDTWQLCYDSSYWKNGPVLNCAIAEFGIDNILFSVDDPFGDNFEGVDFLNKAQLSKKDKEKLAHENAERILKLAPAAKPHGNSSRSLFSFQAKAKAKIGRTILSLLVK